MKIMRRLSFAVAAFLAFSTQAYAQAIIQSGPFTSGHVPVIVQNGIVSDGGVAANGYLNAIGMQATGTPFCINDAAVSGAYHQMCLGANYAGGGGILSYSANGGAAVLPFTFRFNGNDVVFSGGSLALGTLNTTQGSLIIYGGTSGTVTVKTATVAGTYSFNLPQTAGTTGYPLLSGGGGTSPMTWGTLSGNTSTFATTTGALTSGHCATFDASGNITDNGSSCGGSGTVNSGTAGQFGYYASTGTAMSGSSVLSVTAGNVTDTGTFTSAGLTSTGAVALSPANANVVASPTGTGVVTINPATVGTMNNMTIGATTAAAGSFTTASATGQISSGVAASSLGSLALSGNSSGTVILKPQAAAGSYNFNLPITAGTSGFPLLSGGGGASPMTYGSLSGNTSTFATTTGSLTNGHAAAFDASGNVVDGGVFPSGTINSGTAGQLTYYAGSGSTVSGNANATVSTGALTMGITGSAAGSVILSGSSTGAVTIKGSGTTIGTYNFNLPTSAGSSGQPLLSGGGGAAAMVFGTTSGNTNKFANLSGSLTNGNCVAADASGNLIDNGSPCGSGGSGTVTSSTAGQIAYYASSTNAVAGNSALTISGGDVTVGVTTTTLGTVGLSGSSTGKVTIKPQAAAGTYNFNLPTTAGTTGQFLTSAGGGASPMTWASAGIAAITSQTTNFNAASNTSYCADTAGGAVTATLPASPANNDVILFVACSDYSTNNLIIGRNGNNVQGLAENMTVSTNNASFNLVFVTSYGWRIY